MIAIDPAALHDDARVLVFVRGALVVDMLAMAMRDRCAFDGVRVLNINTPSKGAVRVDVVKDIEAADYYRSVAELES